MQTILVTGGAGFIGGNFVHFLIQGTDAQVVNLDKLTYAGNLDTLAPLRGNARHVFVQGDIGDRDLVQRLLSDYRVDAVVNFAAESHVDRSIDGPAAFVETNVTGTFNLLDCARSYWAELGRSRKRRFPLPARLHRRGLRLARARPASSPRRRPTRPTRPIRPRRRPRTTWCGPGTTPTACRCSPPTARTTTGPTSFRRS